MPQDTYIKIGTFKGPHGVRGQLMLRSHTATPKSIFTYALTNSTGARSYGLTQHGVKGEEFIVSIEGVADRNAAESFKGVDVYTLATNLPDTQDDSWYHHDLIGLSGITQAGETYGKVIAVHNFGAGDILEFELASGGQEMLPFNRQFVGAVDKKTGTIAIIPPEYLEAK